MKNIFGIMGGLFLAVGLGLLTVGIVFLICNLNFERHALHTTGKIISLEERHGNRSSGIRVTGAYPTVQFTDQNDNNVEFSSNYTVFFDFVGDTVLVDYSPDKPEDAQIHSIFNEYFFTVFFGLMGLVSTSAGFFILHVGLQRRLKYRAIIKRRLRAGSKIIA